MKNMLVSWPLELCTSFFLMNLLLLKSKKMGIYTTTAQYQTIRDFFCMLLCNYIPEPLPLHWFRLWSIINYHCFFNDAIWNCHHFIAMHRIYLKLVYLTWCFPILYAGHSLALLNWRWRNLSNLVSVRRVVTKGPSCFVYPFRGHHWRTWMMWL